MVNSRLTLSKHRYGRRNLAPRLLWILGVWGVFVLANMAMTMGVSKWETTLEAKWLKYDLKDINKKSRGCIAEFTNEEDFWHSWAIIPGTSLLPSWLLGIAYFLALVYLFLGIALVSDILMDWIEVITSQTSTIKYADIDGIKQTISVSVWNPTVANLTLMALGSSAPEILLSIIETVSNLGSEPGDLGPATIVGSAAFNLMVISGISIVWVPSGNLKKIDDLGIFVITAISSIFAYVWLYVCLELWTEKVITLEEAIITFSFFWILLILAFAVDKIKQWIDRKKKRNKLSQFNVEDFYVILNAEKNSQMEESEIGVSGDENGGNKNRKELQKYLKEVFKKEKIEDIKPKDVEEVLKPKSVVGERLKYRKSIGSLISGKKKVSVSKGEKRIEELKSAEEDFQKHELNPKIGFRCLHYSVTESSGVVRIIVYKKNEEEEEKVSWGIRTINGTATAGVGDDPGDFEFIDQPIEILPGVSQMSIPIRIVDDEGVEPDEDFYVELYDLKTKKRLPGEDTRTTVTILDDDKPGIFGFEVRAVKVRAKDEKVRLKVLRLDGWDDDVVVDYKTNVPDNLSNPAEPNIDYVPVEGKLTFEGGETMQAINVSILPREDKDSSERDNVFSVKLSDVKFALEGKNKVENTIRPRLGKKNECFVEIIGDDELLEKARGIEEIIESMNNQQQVGWLQQFKVACMLSPQLDENNNIVQVSGVEAFLHFCTIGWKVLFAIVPPPRLLRGWAGFLFSLIFIGLITAIVIEMAKLFGWVIGLKDAATAIIFVAIGTSLPDTFASKQAAQQSTNADAAIGNITGSNNINVFLGLGLPWIIGAVYSLIEDEDYKINTKGLSFSVIMFLITSSWCLAILIARRIFVGGELGGLNYFVKWGTAALCIFLWIVYLVLSCLGIYDHI